MREPLMPVLGPMPDDASALLRRLERVRPSLPIDVTLAVGLGLTLILTASKPMATVVVAVLLVVAPVAVRRRWPVALLALSSAGIVATDGAGGPIVVAAFAILAYSAGATPDRHPMSLAAVVAISIGLGVALIAIDADTWAVVAPVFVAVPAWLVGDLVRGIGRAARAREEAIAAEARAREQQLRELAAEERRAMARELHDIVAHGVSVMTVQAGAAREVVLERPHAAAESLDAITATGREAIAELRRLLSVLADEDDAGGAPSSPQPGLEGVPALVDRVRAAGVLVDLATVGTPRPLGAALDTVAYRVIQEGLTNTLRHAPGASARVALTWRAEELKVEVLDEVAPTGVEVMVAGGSGERLGRGLVGLRERVERVRGRFEAGPRPGGGFAVRAWLPVSPVEE